MPRNILFKKGLVLIVILLFIGISVVPSTATIIQEKSIIPTNNGNTLYVGGSGPDNYTKIQDAVDNASDGDTVFVFDDSSPYNENVIINKSINLIGEERDTTVIDGNIQIKADYVSVSVFTLNGTYGFLIKGSNNIICNNNINVSEDAICIYGNTNSIIIKENIIVGRSGYGIRLSIVNNITISNNIFKETYVHNIDIDNSYDIRIMNNTFYGTINSCILGENLNDIVIIGNVIFNPLEFALWDIDLDKTSNCLIKRNTFNSPKAGIYLFCCKNCIITENNFMDKIAEISIVYIFPINPIKNKHKFDMNYWFKPRTSSKIIVGNYAFTYLGWLLRIMLTLNLLIIPIFHFDMNPASEPYDIGV